MKKHYLITYAAGLLTGCATYFAETLREAKTAFRIEHDGERLYIMKIEIL